MRCHAPGLALIAALATSPILANAPAASPAPAATAPATPYIEGAVQRDGVWLGAQPQAEDYAALKAAGVRRIINLRPAEEMATLDFDAQARANAAGLAYSVIPIAGNAGFTPAALEAFAKAMAETPNGLLLHCASGARAGHLYAAWLVRERGLSPQAAMAQVAPLGLWPLPMERLLGKPLAVDYAPANNANNGDAE